MAYDVFLHVYLLSVLAVGIIIMTRMLVVLLRQVKAAVDTVPGEALLQPVHQHYVGLMKGTVWPVAGFTSVLIAAFVFDVAFLHVIGVLPSVWAQFLHIPLLLPAAVSGCIFLLPLMVGNLIRLYQKRRNPLSPLPRWAQILNSVSDLGFVIFAMILILATIRSL
jgi:hypothetical protein